MGTKQKIILVIDFGILALLGVMGGLFYTSTLPVLYKQIAFAVIGVIAVLDIIFIVLCFGKNENKGGGGIKEIELLNQEGAVVASWKIYSLTSVVIGKSTKDQPVLVDLTGSTNQDDVTDSQAVLNYSNGKWFIEDLYSKKGTNVHKKNHKEVHLDGTSEPVLVEKGDMIRIGEVILVLS